MRVCILHVALGKSVFLLQCRIKTNKKITHKLFLTHIPYISIGELSQLEGNNAGIDDIKQQFLYNITATSDFLPNKYSRTVLMTIVIIRNSTGMNRIQKNIQHIT